MSNLSFEQWMKRPVFVVQCLTFALATTITADCHKIRYLTRTPRAQAARDAVAKAARALRTARLPFPKANEGSFAVRVNIEAELGELRTAQLAVAA